MIRKTPLGDVITLTRIEKCGGSSPLLQSGHITIVLSALQSIEPMHHSWWWEGWEAVTTSQPHAALNAKYYREGYPMAVGGELCSMLTFKDGTIAFVKGHYKEITQMIFGDVL